MDRIGATDYIKKIITSINWRRILNITSIVVPLVIAPSTGLLILSQNSRPGDFLYPYKRGTEMIILAGASVNPNAKAFFHVDLTQRRFNEAELLLLAKRDTSGFDDFVSEMKSAREAIASNPNPENRKELAKNLIAKIDTYQIQLNKDQNQLSSSSQNAVPTQPQSVTQSGNPQQTNPVNQPQVPTITQYNTTLIIQPTPSQTLNPDLLVEISNLKTQIQIIKDNLQHLQIQNSGSASPVLPTSIPTLTLTPIKNNNRNEGQRNGNGQNKNENENPSNHGTGQGNNNHN